VRRCPGPPLLPYTTLFRSIGAQALEQGAAPVFERQAQVGGGQLGQQAVQQRFRAEDGNQVTVELRTAAGVAIQRDLVGQPGATLDRKSTRLNSSHVKISYA